ncbi:Beta-1,3-glucan-binding protein [Daphnia magna]|uniref:Beta-1,3-glucan-binding protein n=1 Tax=Daphnia magna TaxID=35525 RepID=A0A162SL33_9CRUS|nr:Beta-1,3-glucan-binding protein [Daphnia magna]
MALRLAAQLVVVIAMVQSTVTERRILLNEEFDSMERWEHVVTSYRMGENQFQYYTRRPENSFFRDGKLFIKPTLTTDRFGENFLHNGKFNLKKEGCNLAVGGGCVLKADHDIANPIQSAALVTKTKFTFTYGTLEVRAKMPRGDWLWPEISLMPANNVYGDWPKSGYIGLVSVRGNDNFTCRGQSMGNDVMESTLEWGLSEDLNHTRSMTWMSKAQGNVSFSSDFRTYRLEWNPDGLHSFVDDQIVGSIQPPEGGFWGLSGFNNTNQNPWANGTIMAPFDQEFFIAINVAVGGELFQDNCDNYPYPKPWNNSSPDTPMSSFWNKKDEWYPTWSQSSADDSALQVDYVRVYAH